MPAQNNWETISNLLAGDSAKFTSSLHYQHDMIAALVLSTQQSKAVYKHSELVAWKVVPFCHQQGMPVMEL